MPRPFHANRFVFLLLLSIAGCGDVRKKSSQDDPTAIRHINSQVIVPSSSPLASRLEVESAKLTTFSHRVTAPASVEADPARYARILPPLNGRILRLFVHPGDRVNRGQELLAMDSADFVGAQADYTRSRSALAQTERTVTRQEDLAAHGIIGQRDVDQARTDRDSAASDFERTKDRLLLLGMDPDKTKLGAPLLDPDTRTAKVRIVYPNRDGRLRPAMFATVTLKTWDTQELTVSTTALVLVGDHTTVFVQVGPNTYEQRPVVTGEQQGSRTIVKSGVQPGDKVLIREGALLQ
jgi:multidrug efflux pump subunit AcrA (membrane-fusion protein)